MNKIRHSTILLAVLMLAACSGSGDKSLMSGNPVFEGRYADPEGAVFDGQYWIYPTSSLPFKEQLYMDAFSSPDLVHWTKHENVLTSENISWLWQALWAPSVVEKDGKYYFYFGANDVHEGEIGGIGVAVATVLPVRSGMCSASLSSARSTTALSLSTSSSSMTMTGNGTCTTAAGGIAMW